VAIELGHAALDTVLDERGRRRFAAAEARSAGWGGVSALIAHYREWHAARSGEVLAGRRMSRQVGFVAQDETIGEIGAAGSVWVVEGGDRRSEDN